MGLRELVQSNHTAAAVVAVIVLFVAAAIMMRSGGEPRWVSAGSDHGNEVMHSVMRVRQNCGRQSRLCTP